MGHSKSTASFVHCQLWREGCNVRKVSHCNLLARIEKFPTNGKAGIRSGDQSPTALGISRASQSFCSHRFIHKSTVLHRQFGLLKPSEATSLWLIHKTKPIGSSDIMGFLDVWMSWDASASPKLRISSNLKAQRPSQNQRVATPQLALFSSRRTAKPGNPVNM